MQVSHLVIAYDRLGFGRSDAHPGVLENDFIRQEARGGFAAIIERLQLNRFVVSPLCNAGTAANYENPCKLLSNRHHIDRSTVVRRLWSVASG